MILLLFLILFFVVVRFFSFYFVKERVLPKFFQNIKLIPGKSFLSIQSLFCENEVIAFELTNLKIIISFLSFLSFQKNPFIMIQFDKFHVSLKNLESLLNKKENQNENTKELKPKKIITLKQAMRRRILFNVLALFIKSIGIKFNDISLDVMINENRFFKKKQNFVLKINKIIQLFKTTYKQNFYELQILDINLYKENSNICRIPQIHLSSIFDTNLAIYLTSLISFTPKEIIHSISNNLRFASSLAKISLFNTQESNILSIVNLGKIEINSSRLLEINDFQSKVEFKPIFFIHPKLSPSFQPINIEISEMFGTFDKFKISKISIESKKEKSPLSSSIFIPSISMENKTLKMGSANISIYFPIFLDFAMLIQKFYQSHIKRTKDIKIPFNIQCSVLSFSLLISDYHKVQITAKKGIKLTKGNIVQAKTACLELYNKDIDKYQKLFEIIKLNLIIENTLFFNLITNKFMIFLSPMLFFIPYINVVLKCFSYISSIIKGPNYHQLSNSYPTPIKVRIQANKLQLIILKNELAAKIDTSNQAKLMASVGMKYRLNLFMSKIKQIHDIYNSNNQEFDTHFLDEGFVNDNNFNIKYNEILFGLFKNSLTHIINHQNKLTNNKSINNDSYFGMFEAYNSEVIFDGLYFQQTKDLFESIKQKIKLKESQNDILKMNAIHFTFKADSLKLYININAYNPKFELAIINKFSVKCDFIIIDKRPKSKKNFFVNQLTLENFQYSIPMLSSENLKIYDNTEISFGKFIINVFPMIQNFLTNSQIIWKTLFDKLITFPKLHIFEKIRVFYLIFGKMSIDKMIINLVPKPNRALISLSLSGIVIDLFPLKYKFSTKSMDINLKNKGNLMIVPSFTLDVNITSNDDSLNNLENFSYLIDVDYSKLSKTNFDPFDKVRFHETTFNVSVKFHNIIKSSISANLILLFALFQSVIINKEIALEYFVKEMFRKQHPKFNANFKFIDIPPVMLHFHNQTIQINFDQTIQVSFQMNKPNHSKLKSISINNTRILIYKTEQFIANEIQKKVIKNMALINIKNLNYKTKDTISSSDIDEIKFDIADIRLFNFLFKLMNSISLPEKPGFASKLSPQNTYESIIKVFDHKFFKLNLSSASIKVIHEAFIFPPTIEFKGFLLKAKKSSITTAKLIKMCLSGFSFNVSSIEHPLLQVDQMKINWIKSRDVIFLFMELRNSIKMNIQSGEISKIMDNILLNIPLFKDIFNEQSKLKKSKKKKTNKTAIHCEVNLEGEIMIKLASKSKVSLYQPLAALYSKEIHFVYIVDNDGSLQQSIIIGNIRVTNDTINESSSSNLKYKNVLEALQSPNSNLVSKPFFKMEVHRMHKMMKIPFYDFINIEIQPISCNISKGFIDTLIQNYQFFADYNIFDFESIFKKEDEIDIQNDEEMSDDIGSKYSNNSFEKSAYGFYRHVEVLDMRIRMSYLSDNSILTRFENRELSIGKVLVKDLIGNRDNIKHIVRNKITIAILKSLKTLIVGAKDII